jgi:response regulator of citrate/malate metabolism
VDLVLLDMHLPDMHGLQVCRAMRAAGNRADVIAVTSVHDIAVIRAAVSQGILLYLLKPFTFAALRDKLERYAAYRREPGVASGAVSGQSEVDRMLATLRGTESPDLPKGMSVESLAAVTAALRTAAGSDSGVGSASRAGVSASEVAAVIGATRITARRYLEYLAETGVLTRSPRYGTVGRPEVEYRLVREARPEVGREAL